MAFIFLLLMIITPILVIFNFFTLLYCLFQRKVGITAAANIIAFPILLFYGVLYMVNSIREEPLWYLSEQAFIASVGVLFLTMIGLAFYLFPKLAK